VLQLEEAQGVGRHGLGVKTANLKSVPPKAQGCLGEVDHKLQA
jgi:hypothetical protein